MNDNAASLTYISFVYNELHLFLNKELTQFLSSYQITTVSFDIKFKKITSQKITAKFSLINGSLGSKIITLARNQSTTLNYAFELTADEVVAAGLLKIKVSIR